MQRSKRLTRIAQLSQTAERIAAQGFVRSKTDLERCQGQLQELHIYRAEYQAAMMNSTTAPLDGYELQKLRQFIVRVDEAIAAVEAKLRHTKVSHEHRRQDWMERRHQANALSEIVDKARGVESRAAEIRQQHELDERHAAGLSRPKDQ